jgi:hypothetical protein
MGKGEWLDRVPPFSSILPQITAEKVADKAQIFGCDLKSNPLE